MAAADTQHTIARQLGDLTVVSPLEQHTGMDFTLACCSLGERVGQVLQRNDRDGAEGSTNDAPSPADDGLPRTGPHGKGSAAVVPRSSRCPVVNVVEHGPADQGPRCGRGRGRTYGRWLRVASSSRRRSHRVQRSLRDVREYAAGAPQIGSREFDVVDSLTRLGEMARRRFPPEDQHRSVSNLVQKLGTAPP